MLTTCCIKNKSTKFETKYGLSQGGALSAVLFVIYTNEIIKICTAITKKVQIGSQKK